MADWHDHQGLTDMTVLLARVRAHPRLGYGAALVAVALVTALLLLLQRVLEEDAGEFVRPSSVAYLAPIALLTAVWGPRHGLLCLTLSALALWFSLLPHQFSFALGDAASVAEVAELLVVGGIVVLALQWAQAAAQRERASVSLLRTVIESTDDAVFVKDREGRYLLVNEAVARNLDRPKQAILGRDDRELLGEEMAAPLRTVDEAVLASGQTHAVEAVVLCKGEPRIFLSTKSAYRDGGGNVAGVIGVSKDITDRARAEQALKDSEEQYRLLFTGNPLPTWVFDRETLRFLTVNDAAVRHYGYSRDEFLSMTLLDIRPEEDQKTLREKADAARRESGNGWLVGLWRHRKKDGTLIWVEVSVHPLRFARRDAGLVTAQDVTERLRAQAVIEHQAFHDPLTGLPNRTLFSDRVGQALATAARHGQKVAVLFLDLDGFKHVNDSLGHTAGDALLQEAARRLLGCLRAEDTLARLGGDEFTALVPDLEQPQDAALVAGRLLEALSRPFAIDGRELAVTGSIGISVFPRDGADTETLLKNADTAIYRAKADGRDCYRHFTESMNAAVVTD